MELRDRWSVDGGTLGYGAENSHAYGVLVVNGSSYVAVRAVINVWNPSVEKDDKAATGQMWLRNELHDISNSNEVGWMGNPGVSNDKNIRFFDLEKDRWWLTYGDNGAITMGYWSTSLIRGLNHTAKLVVFDIFGSHRHPMPSQKGALASLPISTQNDSYRATPHHLSNTPSIQNYGRKPWHGVKNHAVRLSNNETFDLNAENLHAYGDLLATGDDILGAKAIINLWNPSVQQDSEYSSAKIWLRNGPTTVPITLKLDGWTSRIFASWTADSGRTTGCFSLLCPGFVQTSDRIALGAAFTNVHFQEEESGKWWLVYGDNSTVGYWPTSLFDTLNDSATTALCGGDVYSPAIHEKPHPSTGMGSGGHANGHFAYAASIRLPRVQYGSPRSRYPNPRGILTTRSGCYSAENYAQRPWKEPRIYFGGPGRSDPDCP
ncbi:hypothetical protein MUK42_15404 [Musa troglodytarum]|uniref:Neprosin PEP catalytic domain-containing protein n=1 Tax=Musa troglodytarum TaxID=320322 RepID=A0A9E7HPJ4_9LILI|nr:hypothetical protein MUK42_15404 [Musa troglodytarum]